MSLQRWFMNETNCELKCVSEILNKQQQATKRIVEKETSFMNEITRGSSNKPLEVHLREGGGRAFFDS